MQKFKSLTVVLIGLPLLGTSQILDSENSNDVAVAMVVAPNGDVFVTGYSKVGPGGYDYETIKYDRDGVQKWSRRYDGDGADDRPSAIGLDRDENVYVTGSSTGKDSGSDYLTLQYRADGTQGWIQRYNGAANGADHPTALAVSSSGDVWVTGFSQSKSSGFDCVTVRYDSAGKEVWSQSYDGPTKGDDYGNAVIADADGNCYVAGYSKRSAKTSTYLLIKYDAKGSPLWTKTYGVEHDQDARAVGVAISSKGTVVVTGFAAGEHGESDIVTLGYDGTGKQLWSNRFDGKSHGEDKPTGIRANPANGSVVIGASSGSDDSGKDYVTIAIGEDGRTLWTSSYNGSGNGDDVPTGAVVGADGSVVVTGYSLGDGSGSDFLTVAYDPKGKELWTDRFGGKAKDLDRPIGLGVDDSGSIYVAGYSWGGQGASFDYLTLKYSKSGQLVWARRFDGSSQKSTPEVNLRR